MAAVISHNFAHMGYQLVTMLSRLIGVDAGEQGLDPNMRFVKQADELLDFPFLGRAAVLGREREVDLVDLVRSAEVA
jgi:hypothetical protein